MNPMIYDRFQQEAIDHINAGHSVIVSAPTGAGKTAIAEHVIESCLACKVGVIYTAPIKALSNQKFRDFQKNYGDEIGILTGDVSLNANAPVLIMTTEIFRNKVLDEPDSLGRYSWIIYDEIHYIDNEERGTVWEESLIFLPGHMKVLGLSATIPNVKEFAAWIESIHKKPVQVVVEDERPVPLHFFYQCHNEIADNINKIRRHGTYPNKLHSIINYVRQHEGLPCIYFVFGRRRAEDLAFDLYGFTFLSGKERESITQLFDELCTRFDLKNEQSAQRMRPLIERGIAFHHAGMLPTLKEVIERLFTSRLLKVIFTTETFALGINMPSRSVIFDELRKFYGTYVRSLKTRDFYQMAGRAGRRGIDKEGFVYCRINLQRSPLQDVRRTLFSPPEPVRSQLNNSYATILNLYEKYQDGLYKVYPLSLHYYQSKQHQQKAALTLIENKVRLLKENGYIEGKKLSQKGYFAKSVYGYELLLSELYASAILEQLDEFGLGVLAAGIVFEPRKSDHLLHFPRSHRQLRQACDELHGEIKKWEIRYHVYPFCKPAYFHLAAAMEAWLRGTSFDKVLPYTETDEGELVRYFRMSVQILREVAEAKVASPVLKERLRETIRVINRDVVDAEKQLREG